MMIRTRPFRLTGWHVLLVLIVFFGVVLAMNIVLVTVAVRTFRGEDIPKSYSAGLKFNDTLAERRAGRALGWRADGELQRREGSAQLSVKLTDSEGNPLSGLPVSWALRRPTDAHADRTGSLVLDASGGGEVALGLFGPGQWDLTLEAQGPGGTKFSARRRVWLAE